MKEITLNRFPGEYSADHGRGSYFNVENFAGGDDADRIQAAIDEASGSKGTVLIPAGDYTILREIDLREDVTLLADNGARLLANGDHSLLRLRPGSILNGGWWENRGVGETTPIIYARAEGGTLWPRDRLQGIQNCTITGRIPGSGERHGYGLYLYANGVADGEFDAVEWFGCHNVTFNKLHHCVHIEADETAPGTGFVNGNTFSNLFMDQFIKGIVIKANGTGAANGNAFSNIHFQFKSVSTHGIHLIHNSSGVDPQKNMFTNMSFFDRQLMSGLGVTSWVIETQAPTSTFAQNKFTNVAGALGAETSLAGQDAITPALFT